jgi:hypothetical protein
LDERYRPVHPCVVVDVPVPTTTNSINNSIASHEPARVVEPDCTVDDLTSWLHRNGNSRLAESAASVRDPAALPSRNELLGPDAFFDIVDALHLHRDKSAQDALRLALLHIHAASFE